jgi:hypothetical protein
MTFVASVIGLMILPAIIAVVEKVVDLLTPRSEDTYKL